MKPAEKKAARLVTSGAVEVTHAAVECGDLAYAIGLVTGDSGHTYVVECSPEGDSCGCEFGTHQPGRSHAHTMALRLAVWNTARQTEEMST